MCVVLFNITVDGVVCREVSYVLDHCNTDDSPLEVIRYTKHEETLNFTEKPGHCTAATMAGEESETLKVDGVTFSEITHWFCSLLRSMYDHHPQEKKKEDDVCPVCFLIRQHIKEHCNDAYIGGKCLEFHQDHMCTRYGYKTVVCVSYEVPFRDRYTDRMVLAYYHPHGVTNKIFPFDEGKW